jgi:tRNA(Ile)-lysidine synthase
MAQIAAPWPGAVAVSGGGDSLALMHLLVRWAARRGEAPPRVLTVDHGLQEHSAADARQSVRWAKEAGLKAHLLRHGGPAPKADIEAEARQSRYRLMGRWCAAHGVEALYVAHSREDLAETFLLRLARGSGVDGLAAMRAVSRYPVEGFARLRVVRPLLQFGRDDLRAHLSALGQAWLEDPMNGDPRFARTRIRAALSSLSEAGLSAARIAQAAGHLARARDALDAVTAAVVRQACHVSDGAVHVERAALLAAPREVGLRVLAHLLMAVGGQGYRPRFERLEGLFAAVAEGRLRGGRTLHGCRVAPLPRGTALYGTEVLSVTPEKGRTGGVKSKKSAGPTPS